MVGIGGRGCDVDVDVDVDVSMHACGCAVYVWTRIRVWVGVLRVCVYLRGACARARACVCMCVFITWAHSTNLGLHALLHDIPYDRHCGHDRRLERADGAGGVQRVHDVRGQGSIWLDADGPTRGDRLGVGVAKLGSVTCGECHANVRFRFEGGNPLPSKGRVLMESCNARKHKCNFHW